MATLFTLTVPAIPNHPGGTVTVSLAPSSPPKTYMLTMSSPPDNRLTTPQCDTLIRALDRLEATQPAGVLLITSSLQKFFSNGLDLEHATANQPHFWTDALYPLFLRVLTYPMPTIAVLNGHGFAAGLMLAMMCDYRVARPDRGFFCLNEIDFGALLKAPMSSIFREKVPHAAYRSLALEGKRFTGPAALEAGIVDALGGVDEALALAAERKLVDKTKTGVWGMMKAEMYPATIYNLTRAGYETAATKEKALWESDEARRAELAKGAKL